MILTDDMLVLLCKAVINGAVGIKFVKMRKIFIHNEWLK